MNRNINYVQGKNPKTISKIYHWLRNEGYNIRAQGNILRCNSRRVKTILLKPQDHLTIADMERIAGHLPDKTLYHILDCVLQKRKPVKDELRSKWYEKD